MANRAELPFEVHRLGPFVMLVCIAEGRRGDHAHVFAWAIGGTEGEILEAGIQVAAIDDALEHWREVHRNA